MNHCPEWRSELKEEFNICPYCGITLSSFSKSIENQTEISQKDKKIQELEEKIRELEKRSDKLNFGFSENSWQYFIIIFFFTAFFLIFFFIIFFVMKR